MNDQRRSASGALGFPSNSVTVAPTTRPETQKFHIIHPVVVYQKKRSSASRSKW